MSVTYAGANLIAMSPSPVPAAAPTSFSAYAPAPGIGESPTRLKNMIFNVSLQNTHCNLNIFDSPRNLMVQTVSCCASGDVAVSVNHNHTNSVMVQFI